MLGSLTEKKIDRKNTALLDLRTRSLRQIEKQGDEESVNNNLQMLTAVRKVRIFHRNI